MANNNFLVFAGSNTANVETQAQYAADSALAAGFTAGVASSLKLNKVWRQSSVMSWVLAQYITDKSGLDSIDDLASSTPPATLLARFKAAIIADGGTGTVYSVAGSGGTTGLTLTTGSPNNPIRDAGTLTLGGTLGIGSGGTGLTSVGANGYILTSNGSTASWQANGGAAGTVTSVGLGSTAGFTITNSGTSTAPVFDIGGTLPVAHGGTGKTTASDAINNLLPSQTSNTGKVLTANSSTNIATWSAASTDAPHCTLPTGTKNGIICTHDKPVGSLYDGCEVTFIAKYDNDDDCTYQADGLTNCHIRYGGQLCTGREIRANHCHRMTYDANWGCWHLHTCHLPDLPLQDVDKWQHGTVGGTLTNRPCTFSHFPVSNPTSSTSSGYYRLPNGMIHQWVSCSIASGVASTTIPLPITWPNGLYQGWCDDNAPGSWSSNTAVIAAGIAAVGAILTQCTVYRRQITTNGPTQTTTGYWTGVFHALGW